METGPNETAAILKSFKKASTPIASPPSRRANAAADGADARRALTTATRQARGLRL